MTSFDKHATRPSCRHSTKKRIGRPGKTVYKHVPHSEKPPHLVARRNARERRRVETVNNAFIRLRRHVPIDTKHKRLSKVKTLRYAIEYIKRLTHMIDDHDKQYGSPCCNYGRTVSMATTPTHQQSTRSLYDSQNLNSDIISYGSWYQNRWESLLLQCSHYHNWMFFGHLQITGFYNVQIVQWSPGRWKHVVPRKQKTCNLMSMEYKRL